MEKEPQKPRALLLLHPRLCTRGETPGGQAQPRGAGGTPPEPHRAGRMLSPPNPPVPAEHQPSREAAPDPCHQVSVFSSGAKLADRESHSESALKKPENQPQGDQVNPQAA